MAVRFVTLNFHPRGGGMLHPPLRPGGGRGRGFNWLVHNRETFAQYSSSNQDSNQLLLDTKEAFKIRIVSGKHQIYGSFMWRLGQSSVENERRSP